MDRILLRKFDRSSLVGGLSNNIENTAKDPFPDGNRDWFRRVDDIHPPLKSLGRAHRDCADPALTKVLLNFEGEFDGTLCSFETNLKRVEYLWEFPILWVELDIHNWTDDLDDFSCVTHDF